LVDSVVVGAGLGFVNDIDALVVGTDEVNETPVDVEDSCCVMANDVNMSADEYNCCCS